uniref:Peptide-N(4)-(N-acetyl-beta-glucosaminyl)asparagine amidase n=1 Tax=Zea mays TaxID=4577 RepID=A0A804MR44_MAIZE
MVARRFVVRHGPAAGGSAEAAEEQQHEVEYDTEHGLDVLRLQIFSLTAVPPDLQKIVVEADGSVVDDGTDLEAVSERLRLLAIGEEGEDDGAAARAQEKSDEEFARMLQAEEEALLLQQYNIQNDGGDVFRQRVEPYMHQVLMYEDSVGQEAAQKTVPICELEEKALVSLAKEGNFNPSKDEEKHAFLLQLLFWFKQSFRWVNAAPCDSCGRETSNVGMGTPLTSEIKFGASRVEMCNHCSSITRFPRYNDPRKLIQTRRGRCGEWANCFTFYCRAFGYDARLILDFTDHVWTECFSNLYGRWMHLDPCEGVYDNPLLYEKGWNKKLNYVIAISKDGVRDVTKRYTRKWHEVLSRRIITSEETVVSVLSSITGKYRTEGNHFPRGNRVCSGSVLASREQLPIGIATAAFDGIHSSKWEEPDGAKGCWLIYTMQDGKSCELESYDLMSANDAPERDPMDWVLEGSADGGSTWNILDARNSEMFESRFLRKTFTVDKRYKANAFRFRFLRVRDSHSNPRFQIGSIDLYGKTI